VQATNQIGIYQIENLILQRVPFTLLDLTNDANLIAPFEHLNSYYLNFFKNLILKTTTTDYKSTDKFKSLPKDAPVVIVCDSGEDSKKIASELESSGYFNSFYVDGGAKSLKS
jgi:rhodanese-related sulfurtransferase